MQVSAEHGHKSLDVESIPYSGGVLPANFSSGNDILFTRRPGRTSVGLRTYSTWLDEQLQGQHLSSKNHLDSLNAPRSERRYGIVEDKPHPTDILFVV